MKTFVICCLISTLIFWYSVFKPIKWMSDREVWERYLKAGAKFGDAVSYLPSMGVCVGFDRLYTKWAKWEEIYASRGYVTISLDEFVAYGGGFVAEIKNPMKKLPEGDIAVLWASDYLEFVQKVTKNSGV